ncbi:MAG: sigma-54 dependent transcriptional regulator [Candidatus Poribacteria bacterium]|nr:sigma-54 dependent transcriptional regulator [Candidatus Poribacteria bacterium]
MNPTHFPALPVLLVDDEEEFLLSVSYTLDSDGIDNVVQCQHSHEVMNMLFKQDFSVVVLDMLMPHLSGWDLLPMIVADFPSLPVLIITAVDEVQTAVDCMREGTFDYLVKPVSQSRLVATVRRAIEFRQLRDENIQLKNYLLSDRLKHPQSFAEIVTQDRAMRSIFQYIEAIAESPQPVLITGETGVGKEMIANAIHGLSARTGEFIPVNVAGLDDHLFSDTLFGHEKGAFTGAERVRKGLVEMATAGTLFLDEIGDLRMESQVKLLRLAQDGKYYPLGVDVPKSTDARMIVATNQKIQSLMEAGKFRKDLYYRLLTHHIHLPPLRERADDLPLLVDHFLEKAAHTLGKKKPTPPIQLFTLLSNYHFPGNIRELESMVFDAVSRHTRGVLSMKSFRRKVGHQGTSQPPYGWGEERNATVRDTGEELVVFTGRMPTLKEAERFAIAEALKRADGNKKIAAQLLGMSRQALHNRLNRARKSDDQ